MACCGVRGILTDSRGIFYSAFNWHQASFEASFVPVFCASLLFWVLVGFGASARGPRDVACGGVALLICSLPPWLECACIGCRV